jgi:hypothetical protein
MSTVLWVVQANLGNQADLTTMRLAFTSLGIDHLEVAAIPFSDELPDVPRDRPCVFYGATAFVYKAWKSGLWQPCAFFDDDKFRFSYWRDTSWRQHLLNADAETTTLGSFGASHRDPESLVFIRPDRDSKVFAGEVLAFKEVAAWADRLSAGGFTFGTSPSSWRSHGMSSASGGCSSSAVASAQAASIASTCVCRFERRCRTTSERLPRRAPEKCRLRRPSCSISAVHINSAGFYAADVNRIIGDITMMVSDA